MSLKKEITSKDSGVYLKNDCIRQKYFSKSIISNQIWKYNITRIYQSQQIGSLKIDISKDVQIRELPAANHSCIYVHVYKNIYVIQILIV